MRGRKKVCVRILSRFGNQIMLLATASLSDFLPSRDRRSKEGEAKHKGFIITSPCNLSMCFMCHFMS